MNKITAIALSASLVSSAAFAQSTPTIVPTEPPEVLIAGGIGTGGIILGVFGLLVLASLGGRNSDDGGGSSSSSSSSN